MLEAAAGKGKGNYILLLLLLLSLLLLLLLLPVLLRRASKVGPEHPSCEEKGWEGRILR